MKGLISLTAFIIVLQLCPFDLSAQHMIQGTVVTPAGKPIPYATISLLRSKDSSELDKKLANEQGHFEFQVTDTGRYMVRVSHIGFQQQLSPAFLINPSFSTADLGNILLQEAPKSLQEVLVVSRKPVIERKSDRFVLDVENSALASGSSFQLLKTAPFVQVSPGKEITVQGKKTQIYIDGKQVPDISLQDALQSLPAGEIIKVEFITEPSARYDAAYGAVINIVTRKSQTVGFTGYVWSEYSIGKYGIYSGGTRLVYRYKKITLYGRIGYQRFNEWYMDQGIRKLTLNNKISQLADSTIRTYNSDIIPFQAGTDFTLGNTRSLSIEINGNLRKTPGNFRSATRFSQSGAYPDSTLYTPGRFSNEGSTVNYHINYRQKTAKQKGELVAALTYTDFERTVHQDLRPYLYLPGKDSTLERSPYRSDNPSTVDIIIAQADYNQSLNQTWKMETGLKHQYSSTHNRVLMEVATNGQYIKDEDLSSNIHLVENISAAYVTASYNRKNYFAQAGLRVEHTEMEAKDYFTRTYTGLFPNLLVQRTFSSGNKLSFAYRKQINRPPFQEILPYTILFDQYTISQGNPSLKPGYVHLFTLNSTIKRFNLGLSYRLNRDGFVRLPIRQDTSGVTWYALQNLRHSESYMLTFFYPLNITRWWTANTNLTGSYNIVKGDVLDQSFDLSLFTYDIRSNHSFQISDRFKIEVSYYYISRNNAGLAKINAYTNMDAGLSWQALKNRFTLTLGAEELFKRNVYVTQQAFGSFYREGSNASDSRRVILSCRLNFGKTKVSASGKKLNNEDAMQRIR